MNLDSYTTKELAAKLRLSEVTLRHWRRLGRGPAYTKRGSKIFYRIEHVEAWERANTFCDYRATTVES